MRINLFFLAALLSALPAAAFAADEHGGHPTIFHDFQLETDIGAGRNATITRWNLDGWIGSDFDKLWLKSEGEMEDGETHHAEFWAMYSRTIAEFWDAQAGLRQDTHPHATTYFVAGFEGLAPYFLETEAHFFVSDAGDVSFRLHEKADLHLTQRLITQPYFEVSLFAQDVPQDDVGAGVSTGEIGLQTRYEIIREIAPYIDLRYERKFGETAAIARKAGEESDDFIASIGLRLSY